MDYREESVGCEIYEMITAVIFTSYSLQAKFADYGHWTSAVDTYSLDDFLQVSSCREMHRHGYHR